VASEEHAVNSETRTTSNATDLLLLKSMCFFSLSTSYIGES
jgi:hypothetical protein